MAINFPSSPTNGQVYVDSTSGNRYIYVSSYNYWKFASNGSLDLVQSGQIVFDDENIANGSNGLIFSKSANTLFANTINVSGNVSATYFTGNGALLTGITLDPTLTGNIIATGPANTVVIKPSSSATVANTITISKNGQIVQGNAVNAINWLNSFDYFDDDRVPYIIQCNELGSTGSSGFYRFDENDKLITLWETSHSSTNVSSTYFGGKGFDNTGAGDIHILEIGATVNNSSQIRFKSGQGSSWGTLLIQNNKVSIGRSGPEEPGYALDVNGSVNAASLFINSIIATGPANTVVIKPSSSAVGSNTITISKNGQIIQGNTQGNTYNVSTYFVDYWGFTDTTPYFVQRIDNSGYTGLFHMDQNDNMIGYFQSTTFESGSSSIDIGSGGTSNDKCNVTIITTSNNHSSIRLFTGGWPTLIAQNNKVAIARDAVPLYAEPGYELDVNGSVNAAAILSSTANISSLGVGTNASGVLGEIRAANNITAYYSSDIRIKTNIVEIPNALDKINQIRGVEFDWTDEYIDSHGGEDGYFIRKHDVGVIAQEIEKVLPEVVAERNDGIKAVKYDRIVALLIEAVKELSKEIKDLKVKK